jgi:hypothetical protein
MAERLEEENQNHFQQITSTTLYQCGHGFSTIEMLAEKHNFLSSLITIRPYEHLFSLSLFKIAMVTLFAR